MTEAIYPCLWFDNNAKAAAEYYCAIFPNSYIVSENSVVVVFMLDGRKFMGLNGGPTFIFNESVSFVITCKDQAEIDHFWGSLSKNGSEQQCGWLKDKFGVSWQVVPEVLGELLSDPAKNESVTKAFLKMKKFIIADLIKA